MDHTEKTSAFRREEELEALMGLEVDELLRRYREDGDTDAKWALVLQNVDMVRAIANQTRGVYANFAQSDDIIHDGILVLLDAVDKFDPTKGAKFRTYITKRIRGMVIDLARRQHWSSRQVRHRASQISHAEEALIGTLKRRPTDQEMAEYLGFSLEKYETIVAEIAMSHIISFEMLLNAYGGETVDLAQSTGEAAASGQPETVYQEKELQKTLREGIEGLREKEQLVLSLYYEQELNMKEIAHILGISAPRVSQIHSRAIQKLRGHMEAYLAGEGQNEERNETDGERILQSDVGHAFPKQAAGCGSQ